MAQLDNIWENTQRHLMMRRLKSQEKKLLNLENIDRKSSKARKVRQANLIIKAESL